MAFSEIADTVKGFLSGKGYDGEDRQAMSDDGQLLAELNKKFDHARDDRRQYEQEWQENLAFLKGNQWVQWNKQTYSLYQPPAPPWRVRSVTNLIQPVYRTIFGKISAQRAKARVQSSNETLDSRQDARAQDELREFLWVKCDSEEESLEALRWAIVTGTGIHHVCWNKSLGDEIMQPDTILVEAPDPMTGLPSQVEQPNPKAGQPVREPGPPGEDGQPTEGSVVHMGEIEHIAVSPFEFYPEPLASKIETMQHVFYVKVRPASYVNEKYGLELEDETIPVDEYIVNHVDDLTSGKTNKGLLVHEYWERPGKNPEGRYVVYLKDRVLFQGPNPYPKAPVPFIETRESMVPGRFWGRSVMADLVSLQRSYNKLDSQGSEIRNNTARPKWAVVRGALPPGKTISTAPASVIVYDPVPGAFEMGRPSKIEGGDVPPSFATKLEQLQRQFWEVAGLHDFSSGTQGLAGGKTLGGLSLLMEQDDSRVGILAKNFDQSIIKLEKAKLRLARQFYIEPRTITVVGPDQSSEVKQFYGSTIPDDVNVTIVASGALPSSWAAKREYILEMVKTQVLPGSLIPDPRMALKLLGLADVEGVYDEYNRDSRQAERENDLLKLGQPVEAHDYDNHAVHGVEHDGYRKGEEYEQLIVENPLIADVFVAHVESHKAILAAAAQVAAAQAMQAASMQGERTVAATPEIPPQ